jgi:type IX secretion system PorP/SprF family membrane protein
MIMAQKMPMYSQYMLNGFIFNPAMTAVEEYSIINVTAREQWVNFDYAPSTYWANFQMKLTDYKNVGLGATIYTDKDGLLNSTGGQFTYAYHLPMDKNKLSFGLALSFYQLRFNQTGVIANDMNDPFFSNSNNRFFAPDFNVGALYTTPKYIVGLSVDQLTQAAARFNNSTIAGNQRCYYLFASTHIIAGRNVRIEPSVLAKTGDDLQAEADFSARVIYKGVTWCGLTVRTNGDIVIFAGINLKQRMIISYAFDYPLSDLRFNNYGSHELCFSILFGNETIRLPNQGIY